MVRLVVLLITIIWLIHHLGANDLYNAVVDYAVKSRILFAMQRKVLQIQNDALGTETLTPKFESNTTKSDQGTRHDLFFFFGSYLRSRLQVCSNRKARYSFLQPNIRTKSNSRTIRSSRLIS